jgi:hypothetical protein
MQSQSKTLSGKHSVPIKTVMTAIVLAGLAGVVWVQYDSWHDQRDTEMLREQFRTQIALSFQGTSKAGLMINDAHNMIGQCGLAPKISEVYASARKHRFDFLVDCGANLPVYIVVHASDDGDHKTVAGSPPADLKSSTKNGV